MEQIRTIICILLKVCVIGLFNKIPHPVFQSRDHTTLSFSEMTFKKKIDHLQSASRLIQLFET